MCYRETALYVVLCDHCGLAAPEGTGWWTPSHADRAALEAGWDMTSTEHLCPTCATASVTEEGADQDRPALLPVVGSSTRSDICWPPCSVAAARAWDEPR
ncbi:MAG: hypothetical protein WAW88_14965 [Nocardioides sp.]